MFVCWWVFLLSFVFLQELLTLWSILSTQFVACQIKETELTMNYLTTVNRLLGILNNVFKYLKGGCKERARLFSVVLSAKTRGEEGTNWNTESCLTIRRHFCAVRMMECRHRLLTLWSVLRDLQEPPRCGPGPPALGASAWAGAGADAATSTILWFCSVYMKLQIHKGFVSSSA